MNRRRLLQSMIALPAMGVLNSCRGTEPAAKGTFKVFLHGPFGLVVQTNNRNRITAFVPLDPQKRHEFRVRTPMNLVADETQGKRFSFELGDKGLEVSGRSPYIDRGFNDFILRHIGEWEPTPDKYFVMIDLPAPDVITFMSPAEGVLFKDGRTGMMPLDHVLEYRMRSTNEVRFQSKELGEQSALSCNELVQEFQKHWEAPRHKRNAPSQRPSIEEELSRCSNDDVSAFFFGVGLQDNYVDAEAEAHAVIFFNQALLPSFHNAAGKERLELQKILGYGPPCQSPSAESVDSPQLIPAAYGNSARGLYRTVSSIDDCKAGGLIGIRP